MGRLSLSRLRDGKRVDLQSKAGKPLTRYSPELATALKALPAKQFVLNGEIVIQQDGGLSFDQLLMRIHPAASRILKLSQGSPATFIVFDLLVDEKGKSLVNLPLQTRREQLERLAKKYFSKGKSIRLSPLAKDVSVARKWFHRRVGLDGVVAKRRDFLIKAASAPACRRSKNNALPTAWWEHSATWHRARWWDRCFSVSTTMKIGSTTLGSLPPSAMRIARQ